MGSKESFLQIIRIFLVVQIAVMFSLQLSKL